MRREVLWLTRQPRSNVGRGRASEVRIGVDTTQHSRQMPDLVVLLLKLTRPLLLHFLLVPAVR
eukprot:15458236-Alexandrium_andersonii.AAC.1